MNLRVRVRRISQVAVFVSLCAGLISVVVAVISGLPWWGWLIVGAVALLLVYTVSRWVTTRYVLNRIKPVYQLLYSKDIATSRLSKWLRNHSGDDLVEDIQESLDHMVALSDNEVERLVQKERERTEFLEAVSHAVKVPVFNIKGYAQTLLDGVCGDVEPDRQYIERIMRSVERLTHMVDDIEKLATYESGGVVMYMADFDIVELIYEVFDTLILDTREKKIRLKLDPADFPSRQKIIVSADRLRIGQVLESLIANGIKYGKERGSVTVSLLEGYENVALEVTDNGTGIEARHLPHLFEKMYRVEQSGAPGGIGLSLAGVKRIIDAHGEHVTVRSEFGKGTTFTITLRKSETVAYGIN